MGKQNLRKEEEVVLIVVLVDTAEEYGRVWDGAKNDVQDVVKCGSLWRKR